MECMVQFKERDNFSADYTKLCRFRSKGFPLPLGAYDRLRYFIVALLGPSIQLLAKT